MGRTNSELEEQIERCRRLARMMVDDDVRHSLEQLADEYERRLDKRGKGFMLNGDEGGRD